MTKEEKKAYMLIKSVIFRYHGLDEDEQEILDETANKLDAHEEMTWAGEFIEENPYDAFERARKFLVDVMMALPKETRLSYLSDVWEANNKKGYISEMEATAMLKLAKDWHVENELLNYIKS